LSHTPTLNRVKPPKTPIMGVINPFISKQTSVILGE
jgi:hypothetical protein